MIKKYGNHTVRYTEMIKNYGNDSLWQQENITEKWNREKGKLIFNDIINKTFYNRDVKFNR